MTNKNSSASLIIFAQLILVHFIKICSSQNQNQENFDESTSLSDLLKFENSENPEKIKQIDLLKRSTTLPPLTVIDKDDDLEEISKANFKALDATKILPADLSTIQWSREPNGIRYMIDADTNCNIKTDLSLSISEIIESENDFTRFNISFLDKNVKLNVLGQCTLNSMIIKVNFRDVRSLYTVEGHVYVQFSIIRRVFGRMKLDFWGLTNSTIYMLVTRPGEIDDNGVTIGNPTAKKLVADKVKDSITSLDFPTGDVLKCNSPFKIDYKPMSDLKASLILQNTTVNPKTSNLMSEANSDLNEVIEQATYNCMTDRKNNYPGSVPLVMGVFVSTMALVALLVISYNYSNKYQKF